MFSKFTVALLLLVPTLYSVVATPVHSVRGSGSNSLDSWGGHHSLDRFDDFYGESNFDGSRNEKIFVHQSEIVCRTEEIKIVQQRLVVLREMAKRIILEQVCEVESQVIVFEQWKHGIDNFRYDLDRRSEEKIGFDQNIISKYDKMFSGELLSNNDLGFSGTDVGQHCVTVSGSNWSDNTSPASVLAAGDAARNAFEGTSKFASFGDEK